jgi:dTMP kinase
MVNSSMNSPKKGRLVVLEGTDSSGKATQARLLADRLRAEHFEVELASFPRYESRFGVLVGKYLAGDFGPKEQLDPHAVAMLYAMDRFDFFSTLNGWLVEGKIVVLNRYKASNWAHQGARFESSKQQDAFIRWMMQLEAPLPEADVTFFLEMPEVHAQALMENADRSADYRKGATRDQHESDVAYLKRTREIYARLCRRLDWIRISCVTSSAVRDRGVVADEIWNKLSPRL